MTIQGPGPAFMVALPGNGGSFQYAGYFCHWQIPPSRHAFSPFSIILKVRFHATLSDIFHFFHVHSVAIA
jgi:hypothetical protein